MSGFARPGLTLRLRGATALAPALREGLRLLRLGAADLADEIRKELSVNPFLRCSFPGPLSMQGELPVSELRAPDVSVLESLRVQVARMDLDASVRPVALALLGELGPEGYLAADVVERLAAAGVPPARVRAALEAVQRCDPPGIGARSLRECLELQLRDLGLDRDAASATVAALPMLARGALAEAAAAMGADRALAADRAALVRLLRARPIAADSAPVLHAPPDVLVTTRPGGALVAELPRDRSPQLSLDDALAARARAEGFAPEHLARAEALIAAVRFRHSTLSRIAEALIEHQHRFFTDGPDHLRPLTRQALAQALALHPSTVGRAIQDKTLAANGRVWPMAALFSTAAPGAGATCAPAATVVRRRVARLIADEPAAKPLSDTAIARLLAAEGVDIARRTVAKYRETMKIPGSSERRAIASGARFQRNWAQRITNCGKGLTDVGRSGATPQKGEAHAVSDQRQADRRGRGTADACQDRDGRNA